ncbi:hypothetical protein HPG69_009879, partial [Diceros bicornis minor]
IWTLWKIQKSNKDIAEIFKLQPNKPSKKLAKLVMFMAQIGHCYPEHLDNFQELKDLLSYNYTVLNADLPITFCKALISLRRISLIHQTLYTHFVTDETKSAKYKNKVNIVLQNFMERTRNRTATQNASAVCHREERLQTQEKVEKVMKVLQKQKEKKPEVFNFSAIHLIHDPKEVAEKPLKWLKSSKNMSEVKMMLMNLILQITAPKKSNKILLYTAQTSHHLGIPENIQTLLMTVVSHFVMDKNSEEVTTVGINTMKEITAQ